MADGYGRVTGRPGVCLLTTGPGLTNAATAMAQAYSDSSPMLVLSSVNARRDLAMGRGRLHELKSQLAATTPLTGWSRTVLDADELPAVMARAFASFASRRPRPVHIEIPLDVIAGLAAGGRDHGVPGLRLDYAPTYYAAFILDADGNNVEAVCMD